MNQKELDKKLIAAVEQEDLEKVEQLLNTGIETDPENPDGKINEVNMNKILSKQPEISTERKLKILKFLKSGSNINSINVKDYEYLNITETAKIGDIEAVKSLVEKGADVKINDNEPLFYAVKYGHLEVAKFLVKKGANIHVEKHFKMYEYGSFPMTLLDLAHKEGHLEIVNYLIRCGADYKKSKIIFNELPPESQIFLWNKEVEKDIKKNKISHKSSNFLYEKEKVLIPLPTVIFVWFFFIAFIAVVIDDIFIK